jgi:hypothetical protein
MTADASAAEPYCSGLAEEPIPDLVTVPLFSMFMLSKVRRTKCRGFYGALRSAFPFWLPRASCLPWYLLHLTSETSHVDQLYHGKFTSSGGRPVVNLNRPYLRH